MTNKQDAKITISGNGTLNADVVAVGYQARAQKVVNAAGAELAEKGLAEVTKKAKLKEEAATNIEHSSRRTNSEASSNPLRFAVALSFPGEHRPLVRQVAEHLAAAFGKEHVLYDEWYEHEFARVDLDVYLPNLYRTQSELIVIFLCPEYAAKRWCGLEWRHVRQLIATAEASRIMLLHYGKEAGDFTELGILRGDGFINFGGRPAEEIAEKVHERLLFNRGVSPAPQAARARR